MTAPPSRRYIGEVILRRYLIEELVGEGSFAWVYRARTREGEHVAVKILYSTQATAAVRFAREVRVLQALPENPNIAGYIDHGHTPDGRPALVLEFVDGITLKAGLERKPTLEPEKAVAFMAELCQAFVGLHQLGVAHRDVKPENIIMARRGGIKLIDFGLIRDAQGLLRLLEGEDPLETRVFQDELDRGVLAGTPEYMAPEQFSDSAVADISQARTDTWSDVFSLGVILFELLTGRKPFVMREVKRDEYAHELLRYLRWRIRLRDRDIPRIPGISSALQSIVSKALRRDPRRRQPDARSLTEDLIRYQQTGQGIERSDDSRTMVASLSRVMSYHAQQGGAPQPPKTSETRVYSLFRDDEPGTEEPAQPLTARRFEPRDVRSSSSEEAAPWAPVGRRSSALRELDQNSAEDTPETADAFAETLDAQSPPTSRRAKRRSTEDAPPSVRPRPQRTLDLGEPSREEQTRTLRPAPELADEENEEARTMIHRAYRPPPSTAPSLAPKERVEEELSDEGDAEDIPEENLADPPKKGEPAILRAPTDAPSLSVESLYGDWDQEDASVEDFEGLLSEDSDEVNLAELAPKRPRRG